MILDPCRLSIEVSDYYATVSSAIIRIVLRARNSCKALYKSKKRYLIACNGWRRYEHCYASYLIVSA